MLEEVQMPPALLLRVVNLGGHTTHWAGKFRTTREIQNEVQPPGRFVKLKVHYLPWSL